MNYMNYLTVVFTKNKGIDAPEAKDIQTVPEIRQTSGYAKKVTSEDDIVLGQTECQTLHGLNST